MRPELDACNGRFGVLGSAAIESSRLGWNESDREMWSFGKQNCKGFWSGRTLLGTGNGSEIQLQLGLHGSGLLKRSRVSEARGYSPGMERIKLQQISQGREYRE